MTEIIVIVLLIVLFFGGKKIPELMRGMGHGVREFKDARKTGDRQHGCTGRPETIGPHPEGPPECTSGKSPVTSIA